MTHRIAPVQQGFYFVNDSMSAEDCPVYVNQLPAELVGNRDVSSLASHLTVSDDGKAFYINAKVGLGYIPPLDGDHFSNGDTLTAIITMPSSARPIRILCSSPKNFTTTQ